MERDSGRAMRAVVRVEPRARIAAPRAPGLRVTVLASGSDGNATLFESKGTAVLVDAGLGPRLLQRALRAIGASTPEAIVITHAHHDHVGQAPLLARHLRVPVHVTGATEREAKALDGLTLHRFSPREPFTIGALTFRPLPVPHDAAQVALTVDDGDHRAALVTDLGEVTGALIDHLDGCDAVLVESNHDEGLLARGPYPWSLKRRIASARGHLSNRQTHGLLRSLSSRTRAVMLMHLSRTNNRPDLALEAARDALGRRPIALTVAPVRGAACLDLGAMGVDALHAGRRQLDLFGVALVDTSVAGGRRRAWHEGWSARPLRGERLVRTAG